MTCHTLARPWLPITDYLSLLQEQETFSPNACIPGSTKGLPWAPPVLFHTSTSLMCPKDTAHLIINVTSHRKPYFVCCWTYLAVPALALTLHVSIHTANKPAQITGRCLWCCAIDDKRHWPPAGPGTSRGSLLHPQKGFGHLCSFLLVAFIGKTTILEISPGEEADT